MSYSFENFFYLFLITKLNKPSLIGGVSCDHLGLHFQGIGAGIIPDNLDLNVLDEIIQVMCS